MPFDIEALREQPRPKFGFGAILLGGGRKLGAVVPPGFGVKGTAKGKKPFNFSPTAESFGVSAQIGSGVVRGGPEVRFHEDSTRVPPGFHQGSTRVPPGFHQGSTRVPPGFHQGSTRFCESCEVVRPLRKAPHAVGHIA